MTRAELRRLLAPLLAVKNLRHASVIGSASVKPIDAIGDLDVHVVADRMTRHCAAALLASARQSAARLQAATNAHWVVETFRAPVQPSPRSGNRQVHLLIDDMETLGAAPRLLLMRYALTGILLKGQPLSKLTLLDPATLRMAGVPETADALQTAIHAVRHRLLTGRDWTLDPSPQLRVRQRKARTNWQLRCLLKGVLVLGDGLFPAAMAARGLTHSIDPIGPALVDELLRWWRLQTRWPAIARLITRALEQRLQVLSQNK